MTTASGHGHAVARCDNDGAMQVVGEKPIHHRERQDATGSKGFEGGAQRPLARAQCTHIG